MERYMHKHLIVVLEMGARSGAIVVVVDVIGVSQIIVPFPKRVRHKICTGSLQHIRAVPSVNQSAQDFDDSGRKRDEFSLDLFH